MAHVEFTEIARRDLLEAWLYLAEVNLRAADKMLDAIGQQASILGSQPLMGRARPELAEGVRSWPTSSPYILFYRVSELSITVLRVLHHSRDVEIAYRS
jgi:toxin ParE1/3/4